jgi:hypothetical protein
MKGGIEKASSSVYLFSLFLDLPFLLFSIFLLCRIAWCMPHGQDQGRGEQILFSWNPPRMVSWQQRVGKCNMCFRLLVSISVLSKMVPSTVIQSPVGFRLPSQFNLHCLA